METKNVETIIIPYKEYKELTKYKAYVSNYIGLHNIVQCHRCGSYHPNGCVCINCNIGRNDAR